MYVGGKAKTKEKMTGRRDKMVARGMVINHKRELSIKQLHK